MFLASLVMSRSYCCTFTLALLCANASAESPTPTPSLAPTSQQLVDALTPNDLSAAVALLKKNFADPDAISDTEMSRATIEGLMARLRSGFLVLPDKNTASPPAVPLYAEVIENHIGYVRPGSFSASNLQALDKKLAELGGKKVDALVIDLRASEGNDFDIAADFTSRFTAKGKILFSLRKQGKQDRTFTGSRDPAYQGLIALLADIETSGGAEAFATAVHFYDKALLIGQTTAGRAVQYADMPLPSGKILRVAVSEVTGPGGENLYPNGIKPDLPVEMSLFDKRQIFQASNQKGMASFIFDVERPHLNEAALIAGTNPELESAEQRRNRAQDRTTARDPMLQRAVDVITSLEVYQKR
jgi:hypothetical protein